MSYFRRQGGVVTKSKEPTEGGKREGRERNGGTVLIKATKSKGGGSPRPKRR